MITDNIEKKLIIVHQKKESQFANMMAQLIQARPEFPQYEIVVWEMKNWKDNKPAITLSQKVIFIGDAGDDYNTGIKWRYNKFAMVYGWSGSHCVIDVKCRLKLIWKWDNDFLEHYKERYERFKDACSFPTPSELKNRIIWLDFGNPIMKYIEERYKLIICEFVLEGKLKEFMEG